ncbi:stretch-activated Ca2+-permeable channel component-domain-containing protein [Radiomyces spectabilis]|uniref:stretch-activated Ca2+-permeable channel component-domain-containing protein n=1 Tax=Radiomyces spectabilis TaxID=64574 RepID=UPI00221F62BE|nr:stretch-activated Ca2+-permeable channel component-domain-containing protein [Radiomyces spectabilis]KAI8388695.1 stretch-activated Ca2+-permeable channel component-domain-containing protein [Radiomyces spectabilis]
MFIYSLACLLLLLLYSPNETTAQTSVTIQLKDGELQKSSVAAGDTRHYYFSSVNGQALFPRDIDDDSPLLLKRDIPNIFLTVTTCSQPTAPSGHREAIPSLDLFLSTSADDTLPGRGTGKLIEGIRPGYTAWTSQSTVNDVWIGVSAPSIGSVWSGNWTFEIAVSTQHWMHPLFLSNDPDQADVPSITLEDTDQTHALFLTNPYTSQTPNVSILVASHVPPELSYSLCAVRSYQLPQYSTNITTTHRGPSGAPRQQIMVSNLTENESYTAYLLHTTNQLTGLTPPVNVQMKSDPNCRLVYDLEFCDQVAYSVPVNPQAQNIDIWNVTLSYDNQARALFKPFDTALSQFNCDTTQYSLVRNCTDCYRDYKRWICSVTIPRCTSSNPSGYSQINSDTKPAPAVRPIGANQSRNPWIDEAMSPGAWTELLPCIDLCYYVVQSCPPFLKFYCPEGDLVALQYGYWQTGLVDQNGTMTNYGLDRPTCNRLGANATQLVISQANTIGNHISFKGLLTVGTLLWIVLA